MIIRIPLFKIIRVFTGFYVEIFRGTSLIVQLFWLYYALPILFNINLGNDFWVGALAIGLNYGAYMSEIVRGSILSVSEGQWEAADALNFSTTKKWTKIILPQAIPPTIPMLGNYLIIMFKEVPLASTIGIIGILQLANNYGAKTWNYIEPLTIVALLFLILSYPSALLVKKLEQKMNRNFNKNTIVN